MGTPPPATLPEGPRTTHEKEHTDEFVSSVAQNSRPNAGRPPADAASPSGHREGTFHTRTSPPLPADTTHSSGGVLGRSRGEAPNAWAEGAAEAALEDGGPAMEGGGGSAVTLWMAMTGPRWAVWSSQSRGLPSGMREANGGKTCVNS